MYIYIHTYIHIMISQPRHNIEICKYIFKFYEESCFFQAELSFHSISVTVEKRCKLRCCWYFLVVMMAMVAQYANATWHIHRKTLCHTIICHCNSMPWGKRTNPAQRSKNLKKNPDRRKQKHT